MLWIIIGIIISYLIGSIPTAYIFGRVLKGVDIRKHGSGNVGATNALRVLGKSAGISVLGLDILKGFLVVVVLGNLLSQRVVLISGESLRILFGVVCISGHNWTIFLSFKGGKGMATTLGVLLGLALAISGLKIVLLLTVCVWLLSFIISRIVSLASVLSALTLPVLMIVFKQSNLLIAVSVVLSTFLVIRHKTNIERIIKGKEKKIFKS